MHIHGVEFTFHKDGKVESAWEGYQGGGVDRFHQVHLEPTVSLAHDPLTGPSRATAGSVAWSTKPKFPG